MRRAVFLDRDGTINVDHGYTYKLEDLELLSGAVEGIRLLNQAGFLVIVVTNQSGVARGYYTEKDVWAFHQALADILRREEVHIDAFYYCPHHPDGFPPFNVVCDCRKPSPGMILKACRDWNIDPAGSWMVGDKITDIEAGMNAGCRSLLLSREKDGFPGGEVPGVEVCMDLPAAARRIVGE
ncbi:hypothetical protein SY88_00095 [Clostridiales bacterium PH28_bin88]|nr:hypothetical protein SY88_00095 [Clostridiales bacterium PH28_bin88]